MCWCRRCAGWPWANAACCRPTSWPKRQHPRHRRRTLALSPREFEVLRGLVEGLTLDDIGERLHIATKTVSNLQSQIRQRLGVNTAVELLRYARLHALFETA